MAGGFWHVLSTGLPYSDLGGDYYKHRWPATTIRKAIADLKSVGCQVTQTSELTHMVT